MRRVPELGGWYRYGIPNFKLDKLKVVQRRVNLMGEEGVKFITDANIGKDISVGKLRSNYDAVVITIGAGEPRDLPIPNRDAHGIHFAMEFLSQSNSRVEGEQIPKSQEILATDKRVVVIGGGDTGSDCVGTSIRQGAKSVTQIELLPQSSNRTNFRYARGPNYPKLFKTLNLPSGGGKLLDLNVLFKILYKR